MRKTQSSLVLPVMVLLLWVVPLHAEPLQWPVSEDQFEQVAAQIRTMVVKSDGVRVDGMPLALPTQTSDFYQSRDFKPAWSNRYGILIEAAELLQVLNHAEEEGLPTQDYPVTAIEHYLHGVIDSPLQLAKLDVLLTAAFLHYGSNVRSGRFTPRLAGGEWFLPYRRFNASALLAEALSQHTMSEVLAALPPSHDGYRQLRSVLQQYRVVAALGGWPQLGPGDSLHSGSRGPRVVQLRERLRLSGDLLENSVEQAELFDADLHEAVMHFQRRHGLTSDGVVGKGTQAALDLPVAARIEQIEANMERWRWLSMDMPTRYIMVNMAGYELAVNEGGVPVMKMRVIVGRNYRQTPVFASEVTRVVLNPDWVVPPTIIREDILPQVRHNPARLERLHLSLLRDGNKVDPHKVDWSAVNANRFSYTLRQEPGPFNPLGRIKFLVDNSNGIYLHDTPDRHLFEQPGRALSSGCIRLEHPVDLALYLLANPQRWNRTGLEEAINLGKTEGLSLPQPIPIYFTYWTAWVDEGGALQLREDVYQRDRRLLRQWRKSAT